MSSLVRYDKKVPDRGLVLYFYATGQLLVPLTLVGMAYVFVFYTATWEFGASVPQGLILHERDLFFLIPAFVVGVILLVVFGRLFRKYYCKVYQGRIVTKYTSGGGLTPLEWYVTVEGNTYANELRRDDWFVNAGKWQEYEIGQLVQS